MLTLDIDLILISLFLLSNLALGLWYNKEQASGGDHILDSRNFTTDAITLTLIATFISIGTFNVRVHEWYNVETISVISVLVNIVGISFLVYILVPRMYNFFGKISIAEVMGRIYGKEIQIVTACCSIITYMTISAVQIVVFSSLFNYLLAVDNVVSHVLSSIVVIMWLFIGSTRAITYTGMLQFTFSGTLILLGSLLLWNAFNNIEKVVSTIATNSVLGLQSIFNGHYNTILRYYCVMFYMLSPYLLPTILQRISVAYNSTQAVNAVSRAIILYLFFCIFLILIRLLLLSLYPNMSIRQVMPCIIDSYSFPGAKAIMLIALISTILTTANLYINYGVVTFVYDLCRPLGIFIGNEKIEFISVKLFSVLIGVLGLYISIAQQQLSNIVNYGISLYTPILGIPILITILGFRSTSRVILLGMIAGTITLVIWNKYSPMLLLVDSIIPAALANFITIMTVHYLLNEPGGWSRLKYRCTHSRKMITNFITNISKLLIWNNILLYLNKKFDNSKRYYIDYAIFTIVSLTVMLLTSNNSCTTVRLSWHIIKVMIMLFSIASTTILVCCKHTNNKIIERYIGLIWHTAIFITLVLNSSLLMLIGGCSTMLLLCFITNLVVAGMLVHLRMMFLMIICGLPLIMLLFSTFSHYDSIILDINAINTFKFNIWGAAVFSSAIITFIRLQQEQQVSYNAQLKPLNYNFKTRIGDNTQSIDLLQNKKKYIDRNMRLHQTISAAYAAIDLTSKLLPKYSNNSTKELRSANTSNNITKLASCSNNLSDLIQFERGKMSFDMELHDFYLLLKDAIAECNRLHITKDCVISIDYRPTTKTILECNSKRIRQVITTLITNAILVSRAESVKITVNHCHFGVEVNIKDDGNTISEDELEVIFNLRQYKNINLEQAQGSRKIDLALVYTIILSHSGNISITSLEDKSGNKFTFYLPLLQPIRQDIQLKGNDSEYFDSLDQHNRQMMYQMQNNKSYNYVNCSRSLQHLAERIRVEKAILIVDSDRDFLDAISLEVCAESYQPVAVSNSYEAINLIKGNPTFFSMIILAMVMPGKSGEQILREIQGVQKAYSIPIVVFSGYTYSHETKAILYSLGVCTLLSKPCNPNDIRNLIHHYLKKNII